jgi:hypothetical protein
MSRIPYRLPVLAVLVCSAALTAMAALPPRSPGDLASSAALIITGTVTDSAHVVEGKSSNRDDVYTLKVRIDGVEKGKDITPGEILEVRCWKVNSRPDGWAGPGGHGRIPKKDERSRFWLIKRADGKWEPLQPNGIEPLAKKG